MVRFLALLLAIGSFAASVSAQAFDPSITALPAGFKPDDFVAVFKSLIVAPKGEFETTEQYEARKKTAGGVYAFGGLSPTIEYDADKSLLHVSFSRNKAMDGYSLAKGAMLVLDSSTRVMREYTATNAFGASVKAKEVKEDTWGVLVDESTSPAEFYVSLPPDRARELKPNLALLTVVRFGPESMPNLLKGLTNTTATGYQHTEATFSWPTEINLDYHGVRAQVVGVWLYDKKSGEIVGRYDTRGWPLNADGTKVPVRSVIFRPAADESAVAGRVKKGMTAEDVLHVAKPLTPKIDRRGSRETWTFGNWYKFELENGQLTGLRGRSTRLF